MRLIVCARQLQAGLERLRISRLFDGYRGRPGADRAAIVETLEELASNVCASDGITKVEINPLFVLQDSDVQMRVTKTPKPTASA